MLIGSPRWRAWCGGSSALDPSYLSSGHLVFARLDQGGPASLPRASLRAVAFDASSDAVTGDPVVLADDVMVTPMGAANYSISRKGDVVLVPGRAAASALEQQRTLVWVNRKRQESAICRG